MITAQLLTGAHPKESVNRGRTAAVRRRRAPANVPSLFQQSEAWPHVHSPNSGDLLSNPKLLGWNGCQPAASPCQATPMKKPGPAKYAESGPFGAEQRVRTGDLRLGKAPTRTCTEMQRESTRWNLRRSRSHRARQICKPMQLGSTARLTTH